MMLPVIRQSFAKVNRSLLVLGKRSDGFHELDTLFQTIDFPDTLTFEASDRTEFTCSDPALPVGPENLVLKAVQLLREESGCKRGVRINLEKRIPWGAGLGGASSNAAVTLVAVGKLWGLKLTPGQLESMALRLGSDVPFFLIGGRARGTGRGERLTALPDTPDEPAVLVIPPFPLSTPEVFRALGAGPVKQEPGPEILPDRNDLEAPAIEIAPAVGEYLEAIRATGPLQARMSGSGSCLFGVYGSTSDALRAIGRLISRLRDCRVLAIRTLSRAEYLRRSIP
jgi:4-diphosphocytidyl-2-C-methyl-D-erythritol kinase